MSVLRKFNVSLVVLALIVAGCSTARPADPTSTTSASEPDSTRRSSTTLNNRPSSTVRSSTTTSVPPSTPQSSLQPATPPEQGVGLIGVVGCSNTDQSVTGYSGVSSQDRLISGDLGGGTASIWGDPGNNSYAEYWGIYDSRRPADGLDDAWVQICLRTNDHGGVFDQPEMDWISHIVEQLQQRDPGINVWISPINFYEGVVCDAIGPDGSEIAAQTADWAAASVSGAFRGPDLGPVSASQTALRDNCHLNDAGRRLVGGQLVEFFD